MTQNSDGDGEAGDRVDLGAVCRRDAVGQTDERARLVILQARGGIDLLAAGQGHDVAARVDRTAVLEVDHRIEAWTRAVVGLQRVHLLRARNPLCLQFLNRGGPHLRRKRSSGGLAALRNLRERVRVVLALRQKRPDAALVGGRCVLQGTQETARRCRIRDRLLRFLQPIRPCGGRNVDRSYGHERGTGFASPQPTPTKLTNSQSLTSGERRIIRSSRSAGRCWRRSASRPTRAGCYW